MLTNLDAVLRQLRQDNIAGEDTPDKQFILEQIDFVNGRVQSEAGRWLAPVQATIKYDICDLASGGDFKHDVLYLLHPILSVDSVSINGETWDDSSYDLRPSHIDTKTRIVLNDNVWWSQYQRSSGQEVAITGLWGWYKATNAGFNDTLDTLADDLNTTAITFDVADADGVNAWFLSPRFSEGMLVRINSELMQVRQVNTVTNTIGVRRGVNGTTKATHTAGDTIEFWLPEPEIAEGCTRWAMLNYQRRSQANDLQIEGDGLIRRNPKDAPDDFLNTIRRLTKPINKVRSS